jgi:hypothetical protein
MDGRGNSGLEKILRKEGIVRFTQLLLAVSIAAAVALVGGYAIVQHTGPASEASARFSH